MGLIQPWKCEIRITKPHTVLVHTCCRQDRGVPKLLGHVVDPTRGTNPRFDFPTLWSIVASWFPVHFHPKVQVQHVSLIRKIDIWPTGANLPSLWRHGILDERCARWSPHSDFPGPLLCIGEFHSLSCRYHTKSRTFISGCFMGVVDANGEKPVESLESRENIWVTKKWL